MRQSIIELIDRIKANILDAQREYIQDSSFAYEYSFLNVVDETYSKYSYYLDNFIDYMIKEDLNYIEEEIFKNVDAFFNIDFSFKIENSSHKSLKMVNDKLYIQNKHSIDSEKYYYKIGENHVLFNYSDEFDNPINMSRQSVIVFQKYIISIMTNEEITKELEKYPEYLQLCNKALKEYQKLSTIFCTFEHELIKKNIKEEIPKPEIYFDLTKDNSKNLEEVKTFISLVSDISFDYNYNQSKNISDSFRNHSDWK